MQAYLENSLEYNSWSYPPVLNGWDADKKHNTLIFELSLDSGGGTLKFMGKFICEHGSQSVNDIILLSEAQDIDEENGDLVKAFSSYTEELRYLIDFGISVRHKQYQVKLYFVGDFKVYWAILGMSTTVGQYPCPWCRTPKSKLDSRISALTIFDTSDRPPVYDLSNSNISTPFQKAGTKDVFNISLGIELVPPPLHIKLGIINKILSSIDLVVVEIEKIPDVCTDNPNLFKDLLASSLSQIGVRRENYYTQKISGVPCTT